MRCVPTPVIARALCLELAPRTRRTALRGQPRVSATNRIRASFAAESTGGAAILTFNSLPITPQISFFGARGCTLTAKRTDPSDSSRRKTGTFIDPAQLRWRRSTLRTLLEPSGLAQTEELR